MAYRSVYISMVFAALFWSGAFIAGKMAVDVFAPLTLTFWRFLFALPFIFLLLRFKEPENLVPGRKQILPLIILGIIGTLGYHFFFFLALSYTTAINSSLIGATNPVATTVIGLIFFREKVSLVRLVGVGISLFGVFGVITGLDLQLLANLKFNIGDIYMTLGVLCFSTYALLSRRFMINYRVSPLTTTAYTFLVCTLVSLGLGLVLENPLAALPAVEAEIWLEILYMSVLASVAGYYLQLNAISKIGAPQTAMFINLVPVFTIFLAGVILGETISFFKLICAVVIICGVYLACRPDNNQDKDTINKRCFPGMEQTPYKPI